MKTYKERNRELAQENADLRAALADKTRELGVALRTQSAPSDPATDEERAAWWREHGCMCDFRGRGACGMHARAPAAQPEGTWGDMMPLGGADPGA